MFKLLLLLVAIAAVWGLPGENQLPSKRPRKVAAVPRIVGGRDADIADYPYQLGFIWTGIDDKQSICGAVMIGSKWALTAAHCTYRYRLKDGTFTGWGMVVVGSNSLSTGGQNILVANLYQNPQYNNDTKDYDISVLELIHHITTPTARPIPLHDSGYVAGPDAKAIITGWGSWYRDGSFSTNLKVIEEKFFSNEYCNGLYTEIITDRMVCAGNMMGGDSCSGDSGGPLVVDGKLYGVSSFGNPTCGIQYIPSVFCRISEESIRAFIRIITGI